MVVVEGPRFSTRAESRWFTAIGGAVVNMTGHPEAVLARELALCYTAIALVTDLDAGVEGDHGVTQEEVFRGLRREHRADACVCCCARWPALPDRPGLPVPARARRHRLRDH